MVFKIKLSATFKGYLDALTRSKRSLIMSKLSFLEHTGFLGNCKTMGNNIFKYEIYNIKDVIYCYINDLEIIFFNHCVNDNQVSTVLKDENLVLNFDDYSNQLLYDFKYVKSFYKNIYALYKNTKEKSFFFNQLKAIFDIQKENFVKVTGFEYKDMIIPIRNSETLRELQARLRFFISMYSAKYLIDKIGISEREISDILKIRENIDLRVLSKIIRA